MPGINLKHYLDYLEKIEVYAKSINIKIIRKPYPGDGAFIPTRNQIIIDDQLSDSVEIATLLHELGHVMDLAQMTDDETWVQNDAYGAVYTKKCSKKQLNEVVRRERRAWKMGRVIAKLLRIRLGSWYDIEVKQAIQDYKKS